MYFVLNFIDYIGYLDFIYKFFSDNDIVDILNIF